MDVHYSDPAQEVGLSVDINRMIGEKLRLMYREVMDEGVPAYFGDLLKRLDESKAGDSKE